MHWRNRLKRDAALVMLQEATNFYVYVYTNREGVVCPKHVVDEDGPSLVPFQIGHDLAIPIPGFKIDDEGITGTLSFNRTPFDCFFPWDAVAAVAVPAEQVLVSFGTAQAPLAKKARPAGLRLVKS